VSVIVLSTCISRLRTDFWRTVRAAVFAIIAIERMSRLLDYRDWLSQEEVFEHEHSPDASRTAKHPLPATEDLPERDISLSAHEYALSMGLIRRLEDLIGEGVAVQTALDNLDRVRAHIKKLC
jgi:hypothetical protein